VLGLQEYASNLVINVCFKKYVTVLLHAGIEANGRILRNNENIISNKLMVFQSLESVNQRQKSKCSVVLAFNSTIKQCVFLVMDAEKSFPIFYLSVCLHEASTGA
jgi:hypothetical protein